MTGTVENEYNALVEALKASEYTKNEAIIILKEYNDTLFRNNIPNDQRHGVALTTADFIKRVQNYHWKFAHGFYGNWAKSAIESKKGEVEEYDDHYSGC